METIGQIVDKLSIVNLKTWNAQDVIYKLRHMSWEEFQEHFRSEEGCREVYDMIKKSCDLNYQRSQLVTELDEKLVQLVKSVIDGTAQNFVQNQHKTY